jgi:GNAT superfamily N-acetyltransferase
MSEVLQDRSTDGLIRALEANINAQIPLMYADMPRVYHVATVPEARRRGLGSALTLAAARSARELGYRAGVLVSSSEGFGVYHRLGFRECCHADAYRSLVGS